MSKVASTLKTAYRRKKKENPRFSMQLIANRLGISLPFTSQILSGKRKLTPELVEGFARILDLDDEQRDLIARQTLLSKKLKASTGILTNLDEQKQPKWDAKNDWPTNEKNLFWVLQDIRLIAILNATLLKGYDGTTVFLAERLRLPSAFVEEAVEKLLAAKLLVQKRGKILKSQEHDLFQSALRKEEIQAFHRQCLENARGALNDKNADLEARYLTGYITTASTEKIEWARRQAADFMKYLVEELSSAPGDEIYQVSLQLLPISKKPAAE